jgi:chromate transport protein ChrA
MTETNKDSPSTAGFVQPAGSAGAEQCSANSPLRPPTPTFMEALRFWFKLGFISFGGPAGQIAIMHQELVERRRWISEHRFLHALNYCMLLPGPEACQLAIYTGWLLHGLRGGLMAGLLFFLPAFFLLSLLAGLYLAFGDLPLVQGVFYGIKPAVVAVVLFAAWRIGSRAIKNGLLLAISPPPSSAFSSSTSAFPGSCWRRASSAPSAASCCRRSFPVAAAMAAATRATARR